MDEIDDIMSYYDNPFLTEKARKGIKEMRKITSEQVKRNKFYVGANSVFDRNWGHPTEKEAIGHAESLMAGTNNDYIVVKIVAIVKRKEVPVSVQRVK